MGRWSHQAIADAERPSELRKTEVIVSTDTKRRQQNPVGQMGCPQVGKQEIVVWASEE